MTILLKTNLPFPLFRRGKVRDIYEFRDKLLMVATDRISAFDVVLPCGILGKGKILNQLSAFWFKKTAHIMSNHFIEVIDSWDSLFQYNGEAISIRDYSEHLIGRSMIIARAIPIPVECVVRGYLAGSAWREYNKLGTVNSVPLPSGLRESEKLVPPLFTPTTKSKIGHDRPLTSQDIEELGIEDLLPELESNSQLIYHYAQDYAKTNGIIIADTKFEFGFIDGRLSLIDELLTPDSSRFWHASQYEAGHPQVSLDKQPVRDWLLASGWDRKSPPPMLPPEVVAATAQRYQKIYRTLTKEPD